MKIGYFGFNNGPSANPASMRRILASLEACGFDSAWTGEHVVVIDPQEPPSPVPPEFPMLDTIAALAFAAGVTTRIKLGSGIILLAQRNPVVLAKELSGIDVLSGGRLIFGVGVGYVEREFRSLGIPYAERGARTSEHIEVIRTLWTEDKPRFEGRFTSFEGIQQKPMPIQTPHPPIVVGGMSRSAHRRAWTQANGWYGFAQTVSDTANALADIASLKDSVARRPELGDLEISITPRGRLTPDDYGRFEELGGHRLIVMPGTTDTDEIVRFIEATAQQYAK
jgi:probable F420-dependent oxidoreductase